MSIKRQLSSLGAGLQSLLYPTLCLNCQRPLFGKEEPQLCISCYGELALTNYWKQAENPVTDRLTGRLPLTFGVALYFFNTGTVCQSLIHALKYYRRPEVGIQLGRELGNHLKEHPTLADLHGIIPVPIHPTRRHERGYNQAEKIADGMAAAMGLPVFDRALRRTSFTGSQTKKSRIERVDNVRKSFAIDKGDFSGKHLLLVDDVITTGATLDFCGNLLLEAYPGSRVSIATLAITEG
ncbi:ComF family protein [Neolewinella agarilytica]|uniref:ComF family protein n=1 Tax=Neolewinella agarilytica TaxID=478744 RepID=UPI002353D169|nr:ComF family protein [Neolewinella agarilytica]